MVYGARSQRTVGFGIGKICSYMTIPAIERGCVQDLLAFCRAASTSDPQNMTQVFRYFEHFDRTVNSEIFARVLFSLNFANADFRENKTLAKSFCHLLMLIIMHYSHIFRVANMSFSAFWGAKISEFTVL